MQTNVHIRMRRLCPSRVQYVLGRVRVSILDIPAVRADMSTDGKRLLNDRLALKAPLTRKVRRYLHNSRSSVLGFEREYVDEIRPTCVGDCLSKVVVLQHVLDSQILDRDEGVAVNVLPRRLVSVVGALALDLEVLLCRLPRRFLLAV